ncbi:MAG: GDSL-type esterase/lipase family protein [Planctomycetaceae bacterium]
MPTDLSENRSGGNVTPPVTMHNARRRRRFIVVSIIGSTLVALLISVLLLSIAGSGQPVYLQEPGFERTGHKYIYDSITGWRNIPGWRATTFGRPLTINSRGLRDDEHDLNRKEGTRRFLVLGDSYTWGYGVGDEEIFTEILEDRMARDGRACEVINTAVSGWGTDQEYLFLLNEGFEYSPDVVILAFFLVNDPTNNWYNRQYGLWKPLFANVHLDLTNSPVPLPHEQVRMRTSAADMYTLTAAIVSRLAIECAARGTELVVMKFGVFLAPEDESYISANKWLKTAFLKIPQLRFLDLDQEFSDRGIVRSQLTEGNHDGHWNAFGHQQTAIILKEFIQQNLP